MHYPQDMRQNDTESDTGPEEDSRSSVGASTNQNPTVSGFVHGETALPGVARLVPALDARADGAVPVVAQAVAVVRDATGVPNGATAYASVAAARAPGRDLVVVAGAGAGVMRTYLRPNHWRDLAQDPHPGVVVEDLAGTRAAREEQARREGVLFVLLPSELQAFGDALGELFVEDLWSGPKADGDASLYVMRRRSGD